VKLMSAGYVGRAKVALIVAGMVAFTASTNTAHGQAPSRGGRVGATYTITRTVESSTKDSAGSTGSSTDRDTLIERVLGVRQDGLEVEYDLPPAENTEDPKSNWQFPVRVFKPVAGPVQLLNSSELAGRVDGWLKSVGLTRAVCGRWIFTWSAFYVDCDPQSALSLVEGFDLGSSRPIDGGVYKDSEAAADLVLRRTASSPTGASFVGQGAVDAEVVRRERAEGDVAYGQISGHSSTLAAALRKRSVEKISGAISITLQTDASGRVMRRVRRTASKIKTGEGNIEDCTVVETVDRQLTSGG
jgi:hypothetical protein